MRRRDFIVTFASVAVFYAPLLARAQEAGKTYRIAIVRPSGPVSEINETDAQYGPFLGELRQLGYIEGKNLAVERVSADGRFEHYREIVSAVVRSNPDAVFAFSAQLTLEFKAQTTTIPAVGAVADPLALGIVPSLARPGGNITGEDAEAGLAMWGKRLGLLKEAIPTLSRVGLLILPDSLGQRGTAVLKEAAEKIGLSLVDSRLASPLDDAAYRRAFATMVQGGAEAVYVAAQAQHVTNRRVIVELAEQHSLPAIFANPVYVELGGLMAYSPDWADQFRHGAQQIDQILKGTMPGDIPFYQGRKFELMINLKTAKALGIEIPNSILAQADEVIE